MSLQAAILITLQCGMKIALIVGTTSSSGMTGVEASGGCRWQEGISCFCHIIYASVISCDANVAQPYIFSTTE